MLFRIPLTSTLNTSIANEDRTQRIFRGRFRQGPWDIFTRLDFYEHPILLEEADDSEILGRNISVEQTSITIRQPLLTRCSMS